jgi:hypothetical protein
MKSLELENEIIQNIKGLREDLVREVLDFILFLRNQTRETASVLNHSEAEDNRELLLEFGEGLFDGEDIPYDTVAEHDRYLYGNLK